jgi:valyl-tRNA synthetase
MDKYNFILSYQEIINFAWETFCNKYLEYAKPYFNDKQYAEEFIATSYNVFKNILICIHPFCCFNSERIYQNMFDKKSIMLEK